MPPALNTEKSKCHHVCCCSGSPDLGPPPWHSIKDYLLNTNVQLGATYATGKKSTARYAEGYAAAAKYINASVDEIGTALSSSFLS